MQNLSTVYATGGFLGGILAGSFGNLPGITYGAMLYLEGMNWSNTYNSYVNSGSTQGMKLVQTSTVVPNVPGGIITTYQLVPR